LFEKKRDSVEKKRDCFEMKQLIATSEVPRIVAEKKANLNNPLNSKMTFEEDSK